MEQERSIAGKYTLKEEFHRALQGRSDAAGVVRALGVTQRYAAHTHPTDEDYLDLLTDFEDNYSTLDGVDEACRDRWGNYPDVIRTGQDIRTRQEIRRYGKIYTELPDRTRSRIRTVVDYCLSRETERFFAFYFGSRYFQYIRMEGFIPVWEIRHCREMITMGLCRLVEEGGDFLFYTKLSADTCRLNGFISRGGNLYMATEGKVREMQYADSWCLPENMRHRKAVPAMPDLVMRTAGPGA